MRFDPSTKELFTDDGELVKVLHCPRRMRWEQLGSSAGSPHRTCGECDHGVLDTAALSDDQVLAAVRADPSTCLCVRAGQQNLTLLPSPWAGRAVEADRGRHPGLPRFNVLAGGPGSLAER
jgi:hypothetical protein